MERREDRADDHRRAASGTRPRGAGHRARWSRVAVASVDGAAVDWCGEQRPRERHAGRATGVREKARLPDAHEAARQDVLDEAAQKLHGGQRHRAALVAMGVVLPLKRDVVAVEGEQPMIADRHPMGIAPEIAQDGRCATEGRLGVDHPVGLEERIDEGVPLRRVTQVLGAAGEVEFDPACRRAVTPRQTSRERRD